MITGDLIVRSLQGRATAEEEARIRLWRDADPENEREYRALAEVWSLLDVAAPVHPPAPSDREIDRLIARAEGVAAAPVPSGSAGSPGAGPGRGATVGRWYRPIAAGLVAASIGALGFGLGRHLDSLAGPEPGLAFSQLVTGESERTTFTLFDGTAVRLGPNSTLRVIEGGAEPVLWLEGRAYFGVVPDPSRAFTVRTRFGDAVALGTRFEVRTDEQEFRVLVVEGKVRVSSAGSSVQMGEGLMSRSVEGVPPSTVAVADMNEQLEWVGSTLVFRATPLSRVVSEIEHEYGASVELKEKALEEVTITATFTDQPVENVMLVVCQILRAECSSENGVFTIGGSGLESMRRRPSPPPQ